MRAFLTRNALAVTIGGLVLLGFFFVLLNANLVVVRNSFAYAKAGVNIIDHGWNPFPIISESTLSYGKPILFSYLSAILIALTDITVGLKLASYLGTVFMILGATVFFSRLNKKLDINPRYLPLELFLLFFNPLLIYQFWSGYPDSLFAGQVLLIFVLLDVILLDHERDTRWFILVLGILIYTSILTKFYGMILGIVGPVFILYHGRSFLKNTSRLTSKLVLLLSVFLLLGIAVLLARLGKNPMIDFGIGLPGGGFSGYMSDISEPGMITRIEEAGAHFLFAIVLAFNFGLALLVNRHVLDRRLIGPLLFAGVFLLGLLPVEAASRHMRFFIPVFAFLVVVITAGYASMQSVVLKRIFISAYASVGLLLILNFNVRPVYEIFSDQNEKLLDGWVNENRWLDNLRMPEHIALTDRIELINKDVEPGGTLLWISYYYGTSTHGIIERMGLRDDLDVQYYREGVTLPDYPYYSAWYRTRGRIPEMEMGYTITRLGSRVFRLIPLSVQLTGLPDYVATDKSVVLSAITTVSRMDRVSRVEFVANDQTLFADSIPPFTYQWIQPGNGRYELSARVFNAESESNSSQKYTLFVGRQALERLITHAENNAIERSGGDVSILTDLDMTEEDGDNQIVGLRFEDIQIEPSSDIQRAHVQFTADETSSLETVLRIRAELADHAKEFSRELGNISGRRTTESEVLWTPKPWLLIGERGAPQRTADISILVEEVISQPDWNAGNSLVLIISGTGKRTAESFASSPQPSDAPLLYVEMSN